MNARQQRFVEEYLIDLNGTQAAIRSGYARSGAHVQAARLLSNAKVSRAIAEAKQRRSEVTEINAEWVLREAVALYERCVGEVKPAFNPQTRRQMKDPDGNLLFTFQAATAARVLEIIGRHVNVGAFEERVKVEHDLAERINAGLRRIGKGPPVDARIPLSAPEPHRIVGPTR